MFSKSITKTAEPIIQALLEKMVPSIVELNLKNMLDGMYTHISDTLVSVAEHAVATQVAKVLKGLLILEPHKQYMLVVSDQGTANELRDAMTNVFDTSTMRLIVVAATDVKLIEVTLAETTL